MSRPSVVFASGQLLTEACWGPQLAALSPDYDVAFSDHTRSHEVFLAREDQSTTEFTITTSLRF